MVLDPGDGGHLGAKLLEDEPWTPCGSGWCPMATVVTPNILEAELLLDLPSLTTRPPSTCLSRSCWPRAHAPCCSRAATCPTPAQMVDRFGEGHVRAEFVQPAPGQVEGHGTGCTLSSAIAANLCLHLPLREACEDAVDYVHGALRHAYRPGDSANWRCCSISGACGQASRPDGRPGWRRRRRLR